MPEPDISHFPTRTTYVGMAMSVLGLAVVVAILQNLTHAGVLLSLPVLPGRPTADAATAVVSMMGGLVARLASAAALGLLAAVVAFLPETTSPKASGTLAVCFCAGPCAPGNCG